MKQVIHSPGTGQIEVVETPVPAVSPGYVLVKTAASIVSAGTERAAVEFGEKNLLQKARSRPDLVRQVIDKARREGVLTAMEAVRSRLDQPLSLGYSCAGTVVEVGDGVNDVLPGDRVACAGGGYAVHAEYVCVPRNLIALIPSAHTTFEEAGFATLGAIAVHGFRLCEVQLGECVAVIGLGLIGLIAIQLAKAGGCRVVGMDPNPSRCELAKHLGCDATARDPEEYRSLVMTTSNGSGADAVLITAATMSDGPVQLAGEIARLRARVVATGAVGTRLPRKPYFEKELDFRISRSYGPGRYDPEYEENGHDYPIGYVRWTEQRNMLAFLQLVSDRRVQVAPLVTHRFPINDAARAYDLISGKGTEPYLGIVLSYAADASAHVRTIQLRPTALTSSPQTQEQTQGAKHGIGVIGCSNFAVRTIIPAIQAAGGTELIAVAGTHGANAAHVGRKFGFRYCTSSAEQVLEDAQVSTVVIATRHHLHSQQVIAALEQGKNAFCEKPLCLSHRELEDIARTYTSLAKPPQLMVGFNRRFAPMIVHLQSWLRGTPEPLMLHYRVNAGYIPPEHWTQDPAQGGGRILGEACHFIDLLTFLAAAPPTRVTTRTLPDGGRYRGDNAVITLEFANGSVATLEYLANGDKAFGKERLELFGGGSVAVLDDFRRLELVRDGRRTTRVSRLRQDKGHAAEWRAFLHSLSTGTAAIPFEQIVTSTLATLAAMESCRTGRPVELARNVFAAAGVAAQS